MKLKIKILCCGTSGWGQGLGMWPSAWWRCIQINNVMFISLHVDHSKCSPWDPVGDGDLRRRRVMLIKFYWSQASQLSWSCTPPDSRLETWWHLHQGTGSIWFACFNQGQSNLIVWTGLNQKFLLNWISGLESWEHILNGWKLKTNDNIFHKDFIHNLDLPWILKNKHTCFLFHIQRKSVSVFLLIIC